MKQNMLLLLSLFLLVFACQKDEDPSLTINSGMDISVSSDRSTNTISFSSNMDWTARSSDSWCTVSPASGDASIKKINVVVNANDTYSDRSSTVTIAVGGITKSVTINQSANLGLIASPERFDLSNDATTIEVAVEANVELEVTVSDEWITQNTTRALTSSKLSFDIAKNETYDNRDGSITIKQKNGGLSSTIKVFQSQENAIILSDKTQEVSSESQTLEVELKTNVDFEVTIPKDATSWVSYIGTRAIRTETLVLDIASNITSNVERTANIIIKDKASDLQETLTIIQEGATISTIIVGTSNAIQHIDASEDFIFQLNDLNDKEVFFVFSNKNENRPRPLPQLQSNVKTRSSNVNRSVVGSEQNFNVSGKPSITEFNNNPWKQPKNGMSEPQYQRHMSQKVEKIEVGSSEDFFDDKGNPVPSTVRKAITAHGKNLYMWVADNCWGPDSKKRHHVTQAMVDAYAPKFLNEGADNDVYEWVTNAAGDPWGDTGFGNLIPETDDIHIWLTDIDDDNKTTGQLTLGYYYARDNFKKSEYKDSNEKLMFTIDAVLFGKTTNGSWDVTDYWPMQLISTLAHEFTHMIYFYQHNILTGQNGYTAINEMSAQCVEDLVSNKIMADGPRGVAFGTSDAGKNGNQYGRIPLYNSNNDFNLLDWSGNENESLINYSKTYTLGAFMMRNYGGANFIRELIQNNSTGSKSIVDAVNANGGAVQDYGDILQRFGAANLLSDQTSVEAGYSFNTGTWSTSTINGINYELGSINLYNYAPAPYIFNILPRTQKPGSNILYRAGSNLSGRQEWHFNGMNADTKLTVVIK